VGVIRVALRPAVAATVLLLLASVFAVPATLAVGGQSPMMATLPGERVTVHAGQTLENLRPIMPASRSSLMAAEVVPTATADIEVNYDGFSQAAEDAFQAAIDVWETQIVSSQVIHVDATWEPLGTNVLGQAGPNAIYLLSDDRVYPAALAEAVCSCEGDVSVEISASFNSAFDDWYLGTDGDPPSDKYDFTTVVMHELGHGLGFLSSFEVLGPSGNKKGYWGYSDNENNVYALNYDVNEWSAASGGVQLTSFNPNGTTALKDELTDGSVFFGGPEVVAANGGRAKLYAPSPWNGGSSNSHFDEASFPTGTVNALMTPQLDNGEVIHMPGPVTLALFRDIGWTTTDSGPPDNTPPVVSAPVGSILEAQKLGATELLHVSWPDASDDSGIASYELQRKQGSGSFTSVTLPFSTATSVNVALTPGSSYTFRLRASDSSGNTSDWVTTTPGTMALLQETAAQIAYVGSWKRVSLSGASGGKVRKTGTAGYTATLSFTGSSVGFVSTRAAARGIAEIWLDGVFQESVDLYRASTSKKWVIWAPDAPLIAGPHTLEVRVTGIRNASSTKNRIDVDAFLTWP
ncbi:MAG: hypothetical protein ABI797_00780, partial [Chloroflexota bacterium]